MSEYTCFKYRPIDKRLLELLITSTMYFPKPEQLNDPFDCSVSLPSAIQRAMTDPSCTSSDALREFQSQEENTGRFRANIAKVGVGSFSLAHNETLLWSHYAANHTGCALRFSFSEDFLNDENRILGVAQLEYTSNPISEWLAKNAQLHSENHQAFIIGLMKKVLMSKAPAWDYEQEGRIVLLEAGRLEIPRASLQTVLFGLNTTAEDIALVRRIAEKHFEGVTFGKVIRTQDDYGLDTVEI